MEGRGGQRDGVGAPNLPLPTLLPSSPDFSRSCCAPHPSTPPPSPPLAATYSYDGPQTRSGRPGIPLHPLNPSPASSTPRLASPPFQSAGTCIIPSPLSLRRRTQQRLKDGASAGNPVLDIPLSSPTAGRPRRSTSKVRRPRPPTPAVKALSAWPPLPFVSQGSPPCLAVSPKETPDLPSHLALCPSSLFSCASPLCCSSHNHPRPLPFSLMLALKSGLEAGRADRWARRNAMERADGLSSRLRRLARGFACRHRGFHRSRGVRDARDVEGEQARGRIHPTLTVRRQAGLDRKGKPTSTASYSGSYSSSQGRPSGSTRVRPSARALGAIAPSRTRWRPAGVAKESDSNSLATSTLRRAG